MSYTVRMSFVAAVVPILLAGVVSAVIGFAWYHPRVFGGVWMRLSGVTPETVERGKKKMHVYASLALLASIVAAYVLHWLIVATDARGILGAVKLAVLAWFGFVAPAMSGIVLWEQKPVALYLVNTLYWLVSFVVMSVVLVF